MDPRIRLRAAVRVLWAARDRRSPESYVGAYAHDDRDWPVRVAIADPLGRSAAAHLWASFLVRAFVDERSNGVGDVVAGLDLHRASFAATLALRSMEVDSSVGSDFAALVLHADGTWRVVLGGEINVLQLRGDDDVRLVPINMPDSSSPIDSLGSSKSPLEIGGLWLPGDRFMLVSRGGRSWLNDHRADDVSYLSLAAFQGRVARAQLDGGLARTDLTVVVVRTLESG